MRTRTYSLIGALLLVLTGVAQAQQEQPAPAPQTAQATQPATPSTTPFTPLGRVDFGFRAENISGDPARYQRFQDLRQGAYLDGFRFDKATEQWSFKADGGNIGYRDQRFGAQFNSFGKLKLNFDWTQIPLFASGDSRSLYTDRGNGVLEIDNAIQQAIQDATAIPGTAARDAAINNAMGSARQFDLRSKRSIGTFDAVYSFNRDVDFKFNLKNTTRTGNNLQAFGFGTSPGLNPAVEIGVPTDDRTTDVKTMLEFANTHGLFSVGYNGSWFNNHIPTVRFDNPLRVTDSATLGPASGLAVMWPTNSSYSFNVSGSYKLPARSRASAAISVGRWSQDQQLVAPTVNTALVAPPLERPSAEAQADVTSMIYGFTSRPANNVWLNAKFRYYDYANKTPRFEMPALVGDFSFNPATAALWENEPTSIKRKTLDLDASFTPSEYVGIGVGLTRDDGDRTFRIFEKTAEDSYRVSIDSTGNQYVTLRGKYEHSKRTGSGFDAAAIAEVGEQPGMEHYDVADRKRDRTTATVTFTPVSMFDVNASVSTGKDNYYNSGFGLRDNKNNTWSVGFDVAPSEKVNFGLNYGFEKYTALLYSRTANPAPDPQFTDSTRDWTDDTADKVKTFSANLDFVKAIPKTDVRISYDISDGNATYVYSMVDPAQKVFTTIPLTQLPRLDNKLTDGRLDVQHFVRPNIAIGAAYWYEKYDVNDFALGSSTINQLNPVNGSNGVFASTIYSGYLYRNYTAHTGFLRMTYLW
jgi:MtrB/PioB family decaheme-associated outer membrane protein